MQNSNETATAPRFVLIGGFLGAGKSTTVARLAEHYTACGQRVGIVTNDQAPGLVDSHALRQQGFDVGEVAGACFCCSFHELTDVLRDLSQRQLPEVILAEPVGSCTDLVATVMRPLVAMYERPLRVAPYGVLIKPSHAQRILGLSSQRGFSPKADYIFRKQAEEADFLVINRIDVLAEEAADELERALRNEFPGRPVLRMSARTGTGFSAYLEYLEQEGSFATQVIDVDYDVYAEGEAELGWLNAQLVVRSPSLVELDGLLMELITDIQSRIVQQDGEIAHLKILGMADGNYAVVNSVTRYHPPEVSLASHAMVRQANVVINARVGTDPVKLERLVREAVAELSDRRGMLSSLDTLQSFRPGRPVPVHRIS
ncbi:MAG: hypothetical protein KatS3mg111_2157 [Pirellulaceae bacterium]|nr:MAG: hypothetical protein KatS3mg111_2157 [Pirellulaceae bacterium]